FDVRLAGSPRHTQHLVIIFILHRHNFGAIQIMPCWGQMSKRPRDQRNGGAPWNVRPEESTLGRAPRNHQSTTPSLHYSTLVSGNSHNRGRKSRGSSPRQSAGGLVQAF